MTEDDFLELEASLLEAENAVLQREVYWLQKKQERLKLIQALLIIALRKGR